MGPLSAVETKLYVQKAKVEHQDESGWFEEYKEPR